MVGLRMRRVTGRRLKSDWRIPARHVLYREDGRWYHHLTDFPGAFCDADGYVLFRTVEEYEACRGLSLGVEVNVPGGIATLPGYVRMTA